MTKPLKNGEVLAVQPAVAQDAAELLAYLEQVTAETDMLAAGPGEMGLTLADEEGFIAAMAAQPHSVLLCGRVQGEVVAVASLAGGGRPRTAHTAELGISVKKALWGQGVGSAMMQALCDYADACPGLLHLHLAMRVDNKPAFRLYRRFGFSACGIRRKFLHIHGEFYDELLMERVREPAPGAAENTKHGEG